MITYDASDLAAKIIFNHRNVGYEHRGLPAPDSEFALGEWIGLGANDRAVKLTDGGVAIDMPRMVYTETGRHDVTESRGVTVATGLYHLSTTLYVTGESFALGDNLMVQADGGIGKLAKLGTGGTYWVVGVVRKAPATDGTDPLVAEIYPIPFERTVA